VYQYSIAGHTIPGFDAVIVGNVPLGGGLSSSASLEVIDAILFGCFAPDVDHLIERVDVFSGCHGIIPRCPSGD